MKAKRLNRRTAPPDWMQLADWDRLDDSQLDPLQRKRVNVLTEGIRKYVSGDDMTEWLSSNDMAWESLLRAFNRCLAHDARGRQYGWRALLIGARLHTPVRRKPLKQSPGFGRGGLSGALQLLLRERPAIRKGFDTYLIGTAKRLVGYESRVRHGPAHRKFVDLCEKEGVKQDQWPLNTIKRGRGAIYLYVELFLVAHYDQIVATQYGDKARAKANTGTGHFSRLRASRAYDIVELDEHRCHFIGSIGIETPDGIRWIPLPRLVIVLVCDRKSQTVLGFKVRFRPEADTDDVLDALSMACGHRLESQFIDGTVCQPLSEGFPSCLGSPFDSIGFNQLLVDNALIHLAKEVIERARDLIGFDVNYGPLGRPERRPTVEGIFHVLAQHGFHRVRSTTGTNANDPLRQDPQSAATEQQMTWADALNLIAALIADANGKQGKRNFGCGPLKHLQALADDADGAGMIFPHLPPLQIGTASLDVSVVRLPVRGSQKDGRRPYVYFEEEEYFSEDLASEMDLIGKDLVAHVRRSDIRTLELFKPTGSKIGTATVRGRWRFAPHSRDRRRYINKLIRDGYLRVPYDKDPITVHEAALAERARQRRPGAVSGACLIDQAEAERDRAEAAAVVAKECLDDTLSKVNEDCASSEQDDDRWEMGDLIAFDGDLS